MHRIAAYREFARDYRRLAEMLTKPGDKRAMELMATGWDKSADYRDAVLYGEVQPKPITAPNQLSCAEQHQALQSVRNSVADVAAMWTAFHVERPVLLADRPAAK